MKMGYRFVKIATVSVISAGSGFFLGRYLQPQQGHEQELIKESKTHQSQSCNNIDVADKFRPFVFPPVQARTREPDLPAIPPATSNVGQLVKYGIPATDSLRNYDDFILSYDRKTRTANWVLEHLTPEKVTKVDGVGR